MSYTATIMAERYPYGRRYKYPHMKPNDVAIWERFIDANPTAYDFVEYDRGIGDIPAFMEQTSSPQGQAMRELYRLKIDVVGYKKNAIDLIEVKHEAGASSIGQILGYVTLFVRDVQPTLPVKPVLLTNILRPNMEFLTQTQGVKLIVV